MTGLTDRIRFMKCFKAYDIRGRVPDELNEDIAYRLGRALARTVGGVRRTTAPAFGQER